MTFPRQSDALPVPNAPREIIVTSGEPRPISAVSLVNVLLRHRWMILLMTLAFGFQAGFKSITSSKGYTSTALFMPRGARGQGQLSGIAAQFGINFGGGDAATSPQLYTEILEMRRVLLPVANKRYRVAKPEGVVEGDIVTIYNIQGTPPVREVRVVNALRGAVQSAVNAKTGLITMNVTTGFPDLSYQLARNLLDQLNTYNLESRQAAAAAERVFVESQVEEKRAQLRQAEAALANFLESNRQYRLSPQLTLEYGRLQRVVDLRNDLYTSMLAAYEQARIEEVRNLPVLHIIEAPAQPVGPNARGGVRKTAFGLMLGFGLACLIAYLRDRLARTRASGSDEVLEFAALKREAIGDLTHPWRPITRALSARKRA